MNTTLVPNAQGAVLGSRYLVAVVNRDTGRHVVSLTAESAALINPPLIELRCAGKGFGWHDNQGRAWRQVDGRWVAC